LKAQLKLLALGAACVVVQSLFMTLSERRMYPDLVLILALALGLRGSGTLPLVMAFGFGFAIDVLSSSHGLYALLRGSGCAFTRMASGALYLRASSPWALYVFGYVLLDQVLLGAITHGLKPEVAPTWQDLLWPAPLMALLTSAVAWPLYPLIERLDSSGSYDQGWSTLRLKGRG
jgi:rod shape-determining protein MreD